MGTWSDGPFDNDGAADFLDAAAEYPPHAIDRALKTVEKAAPTHYLEVDEGSAAWAACELVALSFGFGSPSTSEAAERLGDAIDMLNPIQRLRVRALAVLPRLADRKTSEMAALWAESNPSHPSNLDVALADLRARLEQASAGPRKVPKAKAGDVLVLPATKGVGAIVLQVVSAREVAVFAGTPPNDSDDAALAWTKSALARRVPAFAHALLRTARVVGNVPLRKDLKGKKLYASDSGALERYYVHTAAGGGMEGVTYEEALKYDAAEDHDEAALRAVALGTKKPSRVRSPDEHEAAMRAEHAKEWAESRATTTPGPFGSVPHVESMLEWIEECGLDNAIDRMHDLSVGTQGYGRPNEDSERRPYVFTGIVALWLGKLPKKEWPATLRERLPAPPNAKRLAKATRAARALVSQIVTRDAALRMIWEEAPDGGEAFRQWVAKLGKALG